MKNNFKKVLLTTVLLSLGLAVMIQAATCVEVDDSFTFAFEVKIPDQDTTSGTISMVVNSKTEGATVTVQYTLSTTIDKGNKDLAKEWDGTDYNGIWIAGETIDIENMTLEEQKWLLYAVFNGFQWVMPSALKLSVEDENFGNAKAEWDKNGLLKSAEGTIQTTSGEITISLARKGAVPGYPLGIVALSCILGLGVILIRRRR